MKEVLSVIAVAPLKLDFCKWYRYSRYTIFEITSNMYLAFVQTYCSCVYHTCVGEALLNSSELRMSRHKAKRYERCYSVIPGRCLVHTGWELSQTKQSTTIAAFGTSNTLTEYALNITHKIHQSVKDTPWFWVHPFSQLQQILKDFTFMETTRHFSHVQNSISKRVGTFSKLQ